MTHERRADGKSVAHIGCTLEICHGNCSKSLLGISWREQYYVFNGNPFGGRVSGNILATLLEQLFRWIRAKGV
eukprot:868386-Rhodomonas_salina.1